MPNLSEMLAELRALEARKGVRVVPDWLYQGPSSGRWRTECKPDDSYIEEAAAAHIYLGSLAAWLSERGYGVIFDPNDGVDWWLTQPGRDNWWMLTATTPLTPLTPLTAYHAAAVEVLGEMRDKESP